MWLPGKKIGDSTRGWWRMHLAISSGTILRVYTEGPTWGEFDVSVKYLGNWYYAKATNLTNAKVVAELLYRGLQKPGKP